MAKELLLVTTGSPVTLILTSHLNTDSPALVIMVFSVLTLTTSFGLVGSLSLVVISVPSLVHLNTLANSRSIDKGKVAVQVSETLL